MTSNATSRGHAWLILGIAFLATGCATTPPADYYTLEVSTESMTPATSRAGVVGVERFQLPAYLDRPQIVTRGASGRLLLSEFHRWAEPLDDAFNRALTWNIAHRLDTWQVYRLPDDSVDCTLRVRGKVYRFDADVPGDAVLDVQWSITNASGKRLGESRWSHYTVPVEGSAADYGAVVAALNNALGRFSADVSSAVAALQQHAGP